MGRHSTGIYKIDNSLEIDITYLKKENLLVTGQTRQGTISWSNRGEVCSSVGIITCYTETEKYIRLYYVNTDKHYIKTDYDYKIYLTEVDSNLGKGKIVYFLCPTTNQKCRKLYNAYGYQKWKSRRGYQNRLYYDIQVASKFDKYNIRFWELDRQIQNDKRKSTDKYNGRKTKRAIQNFIRKLKRERMDELRWSSAAMPLRLRNELLLHGI